VGFGGGGEAAAPKPPHFSPSPRRAAAAGRGPGGGVSPKGQVVSMPEGRAVSGVAGFDRGAGS
jgi:hypothetical protein